MRPHSQTPPPGRLSKPVNWSRFLLATAFTALALPASAQIAAWDFTTASPSSTVLNLNASAVAQHANNGNTPMLGSTTPSSGYAEASGNNNAAASARPGALSTVDDGSTAFEFTLAPVVGYQFTLTGVSFGSRSTGTGPTAYSLRSSADAYATDLASGALLTTSTWVLKAHSGISLTSGSSVTFRLFAYGGTGHTSTANWRIDDLKLAVTLTQTGPADTTPPSILSKTPVDDSSTAFPIADLVLGFDEAIAANSGTVTVKKSSDNSTVDTITVPSDQVSLSGTTATINPAAALSYGTSYYIEVTAGAFKDAAGNPAAAISGNSTWNFTTRAAPAVLISQYYEGAAANDRFVELKNLTGSPISLDGYRLTVWSDGNVSGSQGWKSGTGTTDRIAPLDGLTIPANGYFLVAQTGAAAPGYAASNHDLVSNGGATAFNGDDSVVLYQGAGFTQQEVVDAVSISGAQAEDTSFYRLDDQIGFDFSTGTSILNYASTWTTRIVAEVNTATIAQAWYLRASIIPETLALSIIPASFAESASTTSAATATVSRSGPTTAALNVTISINDLSEASVQEANVTIPIGSASAQFPIGAVNDSFKDGDKTVAVTVSAPTFSPATEQITVLDDPADPVIPIVINEVDCDTPGSDTAEFVELYNNSGQPVIMDGLVLVFYNGDGDISYRAINLTGTIPANGFFLVGNPGVPNTNMTFPAGVMQNGPDAIALYAGSAADFSSHPVTAATPATLLDAVVYDTGSADDAALLAALTPGKPQVNENANADGDVQSIARLPNGGAGFDSTLYVAQAPSPGSTNILPPPNTYADWINGYYVDVTDPLIVGFKADPDQDGIPNGVEALIGGDPSTPGVFAATGLEKNGNVFSFLYSRDRVVPVGVVADYEWSTDMLQWNASGASAGGVTVTLTGEVYDDSDPDFDIYQVTATVTAGTPSKMFVRAVAHN
jgi:Bacterial Ig-like domain/Lamin Tail Domain